MYVLFSILAFTLIYIPQIPSDVDVRVMLTFLELYQTLLGFVLFKLYTDSGLVYPPPRDASRDDSGAGVGAFLLQDAKTMPAHVTIQSQEVNVDGKRISGKIIRQTIRSITTNVSEDNDIHVSLDDAVLPDAEEEEFIPHYSKSSTEETATLPTLHSLSTLPPPSLSKLFSPCVFWLSRETPRPIFEFITRSFGGRIGWPASSGSGSPFDEMDDHITHVIIDRPLNEKANITEEEKERRRRRKYVQPQWVADCINAGKILLEEPYLQGKTLPPHLSPFGDHKEAYDPSAGMAGEDAEMSEAEVDESGEQEDDAESEANAGDEPLQSATKSALKAAARAEDDAALRAAELKAEAAGVDFGTFDKEAKKAQKKVKRAETQGKTDAEENMNKMMMSNKHRKLYERMKYGERKRAAEVRACDILVAVILIPPSLPRNSICSKRNGLWRRKQNDGCRFECSLFAYCQYDGVHYMIAVAWLCMGLGGL